MIYICIGIFVVSLVLGFSIMAILASGSIADKAQELGHAKHVLAKILRWYESKALRDSFPKEEAEDILYHV